MIPAALEPRDSDQARHTAVMMLHGAAVANLVFAAVNVIGAGSPLVGQFHGNLTVGWAVTAAISISLSLIGEALRRLRPPGVTFGLPLTVLALVQLAAINLFTKDTTLGSSIFVCLPVAYAAYHLRPAASWITTAVAVMAISCSEFAYHPTTLALNNVLMVALGMGVITAFVGSARNTQEATSLQLELAASTDPVTGLSSRTVLDHAMQSVLAHPDRFGTCLLIVDVDHFKTVNDTHGHPVGDQALAYVAGVLRAATRRGDIVGRLGGDELVVLMTSCPLEFGLHRAHSIVAAIRAHPLELQTGTSLELTVSIGVAHVNAETAREGVEAFYRAADRALYMAKQNGRDQVGHELLATPARVAPGALECEPTF